MTVRVNGDPLEFSGPLTLTALLAALQIDPRRVAIEHNGRIVKRELYDSSVVQAGDEIEIVNFVGGGSPERFSRVGTGRSVVAAG